MDRFYQDITDFIFIKDLPQKADIIFVPGSNYGKPAEYAAELWKQGYAPYVMPSGRYSVKKGYFPGAKDGQDRYPGPYATEWEFLKEVLLSEGVDTRAILKEDKAQFTYQNALFSRQRTDECNMKISRAILCCKSFHARRAYLYYQDAFPDTQFFVCPVDVGGVSAQNWYQSEKGVRKVLGELERCGSQFGKIFLERAGRFQGENK